MAITTIENMTVATGDALIFTVTVTGVSNLSGYDLAYQVEMGVTDYSQTETDMTVGATAVVTVPSSVTVLWTPGQYVHYFKAAAGSVEEVVFTGILTVVQGRAVLT